MAGTIESLDFEVILKDDKFKKSIDNDLKLAKDLNTKLTDILNLKKKLNSETTNQLINAEKVRQAEAKTAQEIAKTALEQQKVATEVERTRILQEKHTGAAKKTTAEYVNMKSVLRTLYQLTGVTFSVVGIRRFLESMIDITGQFEVQRMALRNMLQDVDGADKIFEDLYRFSSDSTYRFSELAKYAKQLSAFNIDKGSLLETTKMLGDVASGVGVSMDRLILAYGHVKSSGFLRGIQLRSFSQNGVPILDELAKMFSETEKRAVSLGEVFDRMTKREIPFEMVEEAFRRMTSEGGKYYQMQEVLAKTLAGQINILKGRWENMLAAVGQANSGPIKDAVSTVSNLIANYELLGRKIVELIAVYGAYKTAIFLMTLASEGLFAATFNLRVGLEKLEGVLLRNPYALIAAAVTSVGYAIYQYNTALSDSEKITKAANDGISKYRASLAAEEAELDRLYARLKYATEGTKDYDKAKLAIQNRFGPYLKQLQDEGVAVDNLAAVYQKLKDKITEAQQAKFLESESDSVEKAFASATDNIYASFKKTMDAFKISIDEQEAIWHYITSGEYLGNDRNKLSWGAGTIGVPGTWTYKDFGRSAESLRRDFEDAATAYDAGMSSLEKVLKVREERIKAASDGSAADTLVYNISSIVEGIKKYDKDIKEIRDKAKSGSITTDEKTTLASLVASRKEQADLYKEIMGVDYDKDTRRSASASEKAEEKARNAIKANIALLEKYLDIYQKIEPIKGEKTGSFLVDLFGGDEAKYKNLEGQIKTLTTELKGMGEEGKQAADAIEARLGIDAASQLVKADKAAKKAAEDFSKAEAKITEYLSKNFGTEGEKTAAKISKLLADLDTKNNKVDIDANALIASLEEEKAKVIEDYITANKERLDEMGLSEAAQKLYADSYWDEYKKRRTAEIKDQAQQEKEYNNRNAREAIVALHKALFNEQMEGFDLTNWTDKTIGQIREIRLALQNMDVPEGIKALLDEETLKKLENALLSLRDNTIQRTVNPEEEKKWVGYIQKGASYLAKAAASMRQLAEASGDIQLENAAGVLEGLSNTLSAAASGYQMTQSWIGAVVGAVLSITEQILNAIAKAKAEALALKNAEFEAMAQLDRDNFTGALSVENIFGTNSIQEVREAINGMAGLADKFESLSIARRHWYVAFYNEVKNQEGFTERFTQWRNSFEKGGDAGTMFFTSTGWRKGAESLAEIAERRQIPLYDEYGHLNAALLKEIQKLYGSLNKEATEWLVHAIAYSEEYKEAMDKIKETIESIIGSIASNAADKIVEGWISAGNAALDYKDILDDVARAYAKLLVQDVIMKSVFDDKREKELIDAFGDGSNTTRFMEMIAEDMQKIDSLAPVISEVLSALDPYFLREGEGGDNANSLGNGIKGITEETASLLASYLNAIRADVSVMRALQEKGWENIAALAGVITPTLADYVQQIAANTANAAQDTNAILAELRSVIGPAGTTGDVLRVEMA